MSNSLKHYGVLGMRWGHRKSQSPIQRSRVVKTKYGSELSINTQPTAGFTKFLARHSKSVRDNVERSHFFSLKDPTGKKVGEMQLYRESKDSMNVVWVGVRSDQRGKGYAQAAMMGAIGIAKKQNMKKMTLEVPGNSPDAEHIYSKLGFKKMYKMSDEDDIVWGGLTKMELDLKSN